MFSSSWVKFLVGEVAFKGYTGFLIFNFCPKLRLSGDTDLLVGLETVDEVGGWAESGSMGVMTLSGEELVEIDTLSEEYDGLLGSS